MVPPLSKIMELEESINTAANWIMQSDHIVIFTGAGISTESGLPDFRGPDGVWTRRDKGLPPPKAKVPYDKVKPNPSHLAIVELERLGKVDFLISQNVDGLHVDSGFPLDKLAELHGNKNLMMCIECETKYTKEEIGWDRKKHGSGYRTSRVRPNNPICPKCDARIISSIVNFEDPLPDWDVNMAMEHSKKADLFIVLGSSLVVIPAATFPKIAKRNGSKLIINNLGETPHDIYADLLVPHTIGEFIIPVVERVKDGI